MAKLFISYSRKDKDIARKVIDALKTVGHDIWVDWEDIPPASNWMDQIKDGIAKADAFLFLISPDSIKSGYCADELNHAAKNTKRIIPVMLRYVKPESTDNLIRQLQWIAAREGEDNFDEAIKKIKTAIEVDFDWVDQHTRLQNDSLLWETKKDPSLLLRGGNLRQARSMLAEAKQKRKNPQPSPLQEEFVKFSTDAERRRLNFNLLAGVLFLVFAFLTYTSITQRNNAVDFANQAAAAKRLAEENAAQADANRIKADKNAKRAEDNARDANRQKQIAEKARDAAEKSRNVAAAQRSAARAQIYQFRTGELYTSTLLAIDSQLTQPSKEAEELLRENISLLPPPVGQKSFPGQITMVSFNPRGDIFLTAADNGSVCGWQVTDNRQLFCFDSPGPVTSAIFTPTGDRVLAGDKLGNLQIINSDGSLQNTISFSGKAITDITMQPNGRYAAVTTEDAKVTLIDLGRSAISPFDFSGISIRLARFSPNNAQIATGSQNGFVDIWTLASPGAPLTKPIHRGAILTLAYSPNGRYLVTGGADGTAVILDPKTLEKRSILQHDDQVKDIAFNKSGDWFVTVSNDRKIRMWKTETGRLLLVMSQDDFVQNVEVSDNDLWIATTGDDRTVRIWSAITGTQLYQMPLKGKGSTLAFSRNGTNLVAGDLNGYVRNWDLTAIPTPLSSLQFDGVTASAAYSPKGTWIAASADRNIWLLNRLALSSQTKTPPGNPYGESQTNIGRLLFSPTEKWLALLNNGNQLLIYKPGQTGGSTIRPTEAVQTFIFTPDENALITGGANGSLQRWSLSSRQGTEIQNFAGNRITALAAVNDLLAVGLNEQLRLFRIDGTQLTELPQPDSSATIDSLTFSPDGSLLASGTASGQIQMWKRENDTYKLTASITRENVASLAFSPDNRYLAIGALDSVFFINTATLEENFRLPQTGSVTSLSFSPDGQTLMTASLKVLQFWDFAQLLKKPVTLENIIPTACGLPFEDLNPDQKTVLLADQNKVICTNLATP